MFVTAAVSCGKKGGALTPAAPRIGPAAPQSPGTDLESVSEPQHDVDLPEPQPIPDPPAESRPPAASRGARRPAPPANRSAQPAPSQQPAPAAEVGPPTGLPSLGEILTPAQRREHSREIDRGIGAAAADLARVLEHSLDADQAALVRRIRAFIEQARSVRKQDPVLANNLAERARLLAEDLSAQFD